MRRVLTACLASALFAAAPNIAAQTASGKAVYERTCAVCHNAGIVGSPRLGVADDWMQRLLKGLPVLYGSALEGTSRGMPRKGGNPALPDADVRAAVDYMLSRVPPPKPAAPAAERAAPAKAPPPPLQAKIPLPAAVAVEQQPVTVQPPVAPAEVPAAARSVSAVRPAAPAADAEVNAFNRLLRPADKRNLSPAEDGIHDPGSDGTHALQAPLQSFVSLPKSGAGNRVDWVAALAQKKIRPRWDRADPKAEPAVMDLNIVREVKGSMPDVVYPHKQHTEWLDCSNCHPALFVPQKGANQISMAAILLGQKCGVCHGKVAFPVSECRLCHSKKKDLAAAKQ